MRWYECLAGHLTELGFEHEILNQCLFRQVTLQVRLAVHVDDLMIVGSKEAVHMCHNQISTRLTLTMAKVDASGMTYLGRKLRKTTTGYEFGV